MGKPRLFLIDATAFCYRAFYAIRALATSTGRPTNAIYGFTAMLQKILKEKQPEYLGVCFDVSRDTFRQKRFKDYKIQRPAMPDDLSGQVPLIKEIISAYGIAVVEKEGFEADDIISTLTKKALEDGFTVEIISSDKDILQLIDDNVHVYSPYQDEGFTYDAEAVKERFGVGPKSIPDIIALMGDDIDNIPGVPGVGEKTAVELIKRFGSVEKLLRNIDEVDKEKLKESLIAHIERIKLNRELAVLVSDVSVEFDLPGLRIGSPDYDKLRRLFKTLEFKKFLKDLPAEPETKNADLDTVSDDKLKEFLSDADELILSGAAFETLAFYACGRPFRVEGTKDNLKAVLADKNIAKIGHNLKQAKISLQKSGIDLEGLSFDTMLAAYLLNPSRADYGLTDIGYDYLGKVATDELGLIRDLKAPLENELREKSLFNLFQELEMPLVEVLADMEICGIKLDVDLLNSLSRDIEERLKRIIQDIYALSGETFNINSPKQLRNILFEKLKLPAGRKSKTGPSTDEEVLKSLAGQHKLPALLLEYRQLTKLKNTYVDTLPQLVDARTKRVHSSFNQTGTETGRLSSLRPNLQNLPIKTDIGSKIRQAIVAFDEKSHLVSCDYSQIELRILAHLSKDDNLSDAFRQDKDIHKETAALVYGLSQNEITEPMREVAKRVNFGITYGLTSFGLSRDLEIPPDQAQVFIDAYFTRYPKVKDFIQSQIEQARRDGFVRTILGRRRYIPEINNKNQGIRQFAERQAVNTPIQGTASDLIKLAMVRIHNRFKKQRLKSCMIIQIHDELVFNVPESELKEVVGLVKEGMEAALKLDVPIKVEIKKGRNWLEMEKL